MRILLLGASGQIGSELRQSLRTLGETWAPLRAELDLSDTAAVKRYIAQARPSLVVNASGYTAVDRAEDEPELARKLNTDLPAALAEATKSVDGLLIHYSTDYVFDGNTARPYREEDPTAPINVYGRTKRDGDLAILASGSRAVVLRIGWVYGHHGRNFLKTIFRLADEGKPLRVVSDQYGVPTWAGLIATATTSVAESADRQGAHGLFHFSPTGATTWHELAVRALALRSSNPPPIRAIKSAEFPTKARRPAYSVLDSRRFEQTFGFVLHPWTHYLKSYFAAGKIDR